MKKSNNSFVFSRFKIIFFIILVFIIAVSSSIYIYSKHNEHNKKINNFISSISNDKLKILGKLKYKRDNYNAIYMDSNHIFIIGRGNSDISKTAEIFDIKKKRTTKIIHLKNEHSADFLYRFKNNIIIIGNTIEIIDIETLDVKEIYSSKDDISFSGGFVTSLNDEELLFICGNTSLPIMFVDDTPFVFKYNIKTGSIINIEQSNIPRGLFNGIISIKKPLLNLNGNVLLFACDYKKVYKDNLGNNINSVVPNNCGIYSYIYKKDKFIMVKELSESSFPYYTWAIDSNNLLVIGQRYSFKYNITENKFEKISYDEQKIHPFAKYVTNDKENNIICIGTEYLKSPFGKDSFSINLNNNSISKTIIIDFNKTALFSDYGNGTALPLRNGKVLFVGLLNMNYVFLYN